MGVDEIQALLGKLNQSPDDVALRGQTAAALESAGRHPEVLTVLAPLVNVTGHDDDTGLPCLCKRCLPLAADSADAAGMQFRRTFAIARDRVLHYWTLRDLPRDTVRRDVAAALDARLRPARKK